MNRQRVQVFGLVLLLGLLGLLTLVIFAPEVLYCNRLVYQLLRMIPAGCLKWSAK